MPTETAAVSEIKPQTPFISRNLTSNIKEGIFSVLLFRPDTYGTHQCQIFPVFGLAFSECALLDVSASNLVVFNRHHFELTVCIYYFYQAFIL